MIRPADLWNKRNHIAVISASAALILVLAVIDWLTKPYFALGFLYLFPIMLAAGFLPRWVIGLAAIVCAYLAETFSSLDPSDSRIRFAVFTIALCGSGLFLSAVLRNHRLGLAAQERIRVLVETSPAAIVTIDEN